MKTRTLVSAILAVLPCAASAVYLNPDGQGQALIYPYYTVQSANGNAFNTYLSVVNHTTNAKALRVRVRESRNSREVASFNLYLSPNDAWTAAIIPLLDGNPAAHLLSGDRSCVSPALTGASSTPGVTFRNNFYSGSFDDGNGTGLDRTREGWVEILEMASLSGAAAAAVTQNSAGIPANCAAVQSLSEGDIAPPTGGLSGTLTLINVANGMDFTVNAEALAELSSRSFYRPAADSYPDLNAVEIDPVSIVVANGSIYRSTWNRAADAVSAVLMRSEILAEYVLDTGTQSKTGIALAFPTRQFFVNAASAAAPFSWTPQWSATCASGGERLSVQSFDREEAATPPPVSSFGEPLPPDPAFCASVPVFGFSNGQAHLGDGSEANVLGTQSRGLTTRNVNVRATFSSGWARITQPAPLALVSLGTSTRIAIATGVSTTGSHSFVGLPVTGLAVRTFVNGALTCSGGACQGNYGGAFPLKYRRSISSN